MKALLVIKELSGPWRFTCISPKQLDLLPVRKTDFWWLFNFLHGINLSTSLGCSYNFVLLFKGLIVFLGTVIFDFHIYIANNFSSLSSFFPICIPSYIEIFFFCFQEFKSIHPIMVSGSGIMFVNVFPILIWGRYSLIFSSDCFIFYIYILIE